MPEPDIRLVVNADGFAASPAISRGVIKAHRMGVVTSTSVHGNFVGSACEVTDLLKEHPDLGVGVQLVLIGGAPVAGADSLPSLVQPDGHFPGDPRAFALRWAKAQILSADLEREFTAQIARIHDAGIKVDHLNTFLHLGFFPVVAQAMENVARKFGIATLRTAMEKPNLAWFTDLQKGLPLAALKGLAWFSRRYLGARGHGPQSWGYAESGNLGRMRILEILGRMGPGIHELICHPGEQPEPEIDILGHKQILDRAIEMEALISEEVKGAMKHRNIELCRFGDLF